MIVNYDRKTFIVEALAFRKKFFKNYDIVAGHQGPPGDLAADAVHRAQHHHVRRLPEPVVHVQVSTPANLFSLVANGEAN
jgi:hypothetical protein